MSRQFVVTLLLTCFSALHLASADEPVRIGAVLSLTGDLAMTGAAFREGIQLALEDFRQANKDASVELKLEDNKVDAGSSFRASKKLLTFDHICAGLISAHLDAMAAGAEYERAKVPAIVLWDSNPEIDKLGDYIFSVGPWTPSAGQSAARFSLENLRAKRAVMFTNPDYWSETVARFYSEEFTRLGGQVLDTIFLTADTRDFRSTLSKMRQLKPDIIYTPLVYNLDSFYRQLRELHFSEPIVTSDIITEENIRLYPDVYEGIYQSGIVDPQNPVFAALRTRYEKHFGKALTMPWFVATSYDAMMLLLEAVKKSGCASDALRASLAKVHGYAGASGTISMNEHGTSPVFEHMFQIRRGKLEPVSVISHSSRGSAQLPVSPEDPASPTPEQE